jgi:hypothetical protein
VRVEGEKPAEIGQKQAKTEENPKKTVEIAVFRLTLTTPKPHCNERRDSPNPHEYRGNVQALPG